MFFISASLSGVRPHCCIVSVVTGSSLGPGTWSELFYGLVSDSNWRLQQVTWMNNSRMPEIILKCGPSGRKRLGRPSKRLGEAETGTLRRLVTDVDDVSTNLMYCKDFCYYRQ
jgi:hypothetical protein